MTPTGVVSGALFTSGFSTFKRPGAEYMAIRHLRNAVALNPDNPQGYLQLGLAYRQLYFSEVGAYMMAQQKLYEEFRKKQQAAALTSSVAS